MLVFIHEKRYNLIMKNQKLRVIKEPFFEPIRPDFVIDFGNGEKVILNLRVIGSKNTNEKEIAEKIVAKILQENIFSGKWNFAIEETEYIISHGIDFDVKILKLVSPEEIALCKTVFKKPLKTYREKFVFKEMVSLFEDMKHCEMPGKEKVGRKVYSACRRVNEKVSKRFGISEDIIKYNGRLKIVSANKKIF